MATMSSGQLMAMLLGDLMAWLWEVWMENVWDILMVTLLEYLLDNSTALKTENLMEDMLANLTGRKIIRSHICHDQIFPTLRIEQLLSIHMSMTMY